MSIEELLQKMEEYHLCREHKDHRPEWLKTFVYRVAEVFEPLTSVGRIGYDCQLDEHGWLVCMYLGTTEIIGGPRDGQIDPASFRINLHQLSDLLTSVSRLEWYSVSEAPADTTHPLPRSLISLHGTVADGQDVKLELLSAPPRYVRPGLHQKPGGRVLAPERQQP